MLVVAAGVFSAVAPIADLDSEEWRRAMAVNVDAVAELLRLLHPLLLEVGRVSRCRVDRARRTCRRRASGAAAYSASKAALTQLGRVAALEWAGDGIRVNSVHPDAVFDTGLWTADSGRGAGGKLRADRR